ncbi:MAG: ATP-binding cassette domain-containing protein, partial [Bacteroidales bacterium]|nr:ATP-binding cassette domain-containing protein [Bacteroidales bacterium]
AGKSTTMKIITGCLASDSGDVFINGVNTKDNFKEIKKTIGYLPENNPLYLNMYVKEYLEYSASMYLDSKKINAAVENAIQAVGLSSHKSKRIGELSKGYKQRTGIARAIIHNPSILILDEPTTGLDPNQILEIRNLIKELGKEKTVILSTHIMQEAEAVCDRALIINKGKIVADDSLKNLKTKYTGDSTIVEFDLKNISGVDFQKKINEFAQKEGFSILSITKNKGNLENIFRELTTE